MGHKLLAQGTGRTAYGENNSAFCLTPRAVFITHDSSTLVLQHSVNGYPAS